MKTMKKLASLIMALAMVLALAVSVSAEDSTPSITINNSGKDETYNVYKLFNATYNETTKTVAYTVIDSIGIPDGLSSYFEADPNTGAVTYKGTGTTFEYNSDLAVALKTWAGTASAVKTNVKGVGGPLKIDLSNVVDGKETGFGYYVITSTVGEGTAVTVTSVSPAATVNEKNNYDIPVVENGQKVDYTISFETVNFVDQTNTNAANAKKVEKYIITDNLAGGKLTNIEAVSVKVDNQDVTYTRENGVFTIDWLGTDGNSLYKNGATITIKYTATVNSTTGAEAITNKFKVEYKLVGVDEPGKVPTEPEVTVYTSKITVNKVDEGNQPLPGADFALKDDATGMFYSVDNNGVVTWSTTQPQPSDDITKTVFEFTGLKYGNYTLVEIRTPDGYNTVDPNSENLKVKVEAGTSATHATIVSRNVVNLAGVELPETGGIGTTIFTAVGSILMVGAAILYITKKRSEDCAN